MMFILKAITREIATISLFVRTIATVFLALGMGMAMAQDNLSITPANRDVTNEAGSTDFTVTTNLPLNELTITITPETEWTEAVADADWSGRTNHTSVVFDNKMWVIGGWDGSHFLDDVWSSTDGITWTQVTTTGTIWSGRSTHTLVVFDNKMWVIGGIGDSNTYLNDVWSSPDGSTWTRATADAAWSARWNHTSVVFDNKMWVIGGWNGSHQDDVWYSIDGITWTQATNNASWSGRNTHASVVFDNNMWVIGGGDGSRQNDAWYIEGYDWTASLSGTTLTVDYMTNDIAASRTGTITVSDRGLTETVTVTQAEAVPELVLSPATQNVGAETGSTDFTVTTNVPSGDLTITDDADWLTTERSGTTLTATYEANEVAAPRTGTVTVSGGGLTRTVTVAQAGAVPSLALSPDNQGVTAEAGSATFTVTTNIPSGDLTINDDADWLTTERSGTTLTATYEANSVAGLRTGTVTVSGGGLTEMVTVTQVELGVVFELSPATQSVNAATGIATFTVTTNIPSGDLTLTAEADWLTVSLSGTTLTATYEANSIAASRTGTVTVTETATGGGLILTATVVQAGAAPELALSPANRDVSAETGSTNFTVTTNVPSGDLTITDDADWLTVGLIGTTLTTDYGANGIAAPRTGTVTISGGGLTRTVTVTQARGYPELALSPATQSVTSEAGSTDFTVTTNVPSGDLTITDDADWLTVGLSGTTLTADYEANSDTGPRTGTITISGGGLNETVTVTQAQVGVVFELTISPAVQSVTSEAGSTDFTVTTNLPADALTTTDDAAWLTVGLSGSSSPYTSTADYEANSDTSPRTGTVTVSGGGLTRTVTVTQAAFVPELSLSPATQSVTSEAGSTDFTVTTNVPSGDLTITDDADWLTVSLSGTTLTADYEANSSTLPRTGTMTVSGGGLTETVTVTQAGAAPELALSPANRDITAEAGSTDFTVTTNLSANDLTITDDANWLTVSLSGTSSPYTLTADYEANSSTLPRTGTMTVSGGGLTETVTVTQAGAAPELALSPANRDITAEAGSTDFTVTTNLSANDLTITDDANWLTVSLSGTSSPYTLTADYEANSSTLPRTGTMTVSGGGLTETVTVEQEGTPLGLEDETALVVYPNPGVAQVTVDFGDMAQGEGKAWTLLDSSGKNMRSGWVARGETTLVINTQGLLSGLYLFQVRGEGQKSYVSHRVVIRH